MKKKQKKVPEYAVFLKQARLAKGLTIERVAKKVRVSRAAVSYWEKGSREPKISDFEKWISVFGLKIVINKK